ncbi:glycosyltransferase family 4 protein [candidate division KSB1 bacterium]
MDKIKVLYIDEISRIAGGETWFLNYIDGLEGKDIEPILVCPSGPFSDAAKSKGIQVINYEFAFEDISSHKWWKYFLFAVSRIKDTFYINKIAKNIKINIIHSVNVNGHVISSMIRTLFSKKVLWQIHHDHQKILYRLFKPDYMVFVAKVRAEMIKNLGIENKRKHSVLYNGIDISEFEKIEKSENSQIKIGFVGRIQPSKGVETLLESIPILTNKYNNLKFDFYGEEMDWDVLGGTYIDTVKIKINELKISGNVNFHGHIFPPSKIYQNMDIFVMPSHRFGESCPMVILEAMAAGVPVIATTVGGIPEIITHGETGFLIPPKDPQAISDAVEYVINNPEHVKQVVENAKKEVRKRFDFRENARQFVEIYKEMLNESD